MLDLGFDGFMQDYGEQVLFDMHFADGTTGVTLHNDYLTSTPRRPAGDQPLRQSTRSVIPGSSPAPATPAGPAPPRTRAPTSPGTRRPTGPAPRGSLHSPPTCSTARSAGPTASAPTSAATSTTTPRHHEGALPALGGVGGAEPRLPAARRRADRHPHAVGLRRADGAGLQAALAPPPEGRTAASFASGARRRGRESPTRPLWLTYPHDPTARAQDQEWLLGTGRPGRPGDRARRDLQERLFPAGVLEGRGDGPAAPRQELRSGLGPAHGAAPLLPLWDTSAQPPAQMTRNFAAAG